MSRVRILAPAVTIAVALGIAGAAFAALPKPGPFAGKASLHSINGFPTSSRSSRRRAAAR